MLKRMLIAGWGLYFMGVALLLGFPSHLVRRWTIAVLLVLSLVLIAASVAFALGAAYQRAAGGGREEIVQMGTAEQQAPDRGWKPRVERSLAVGWALFIVSASVALLFPRSRWSLGPELLFALCAVVIVSSILYAAYLVLLRFTKRVRR
jgi:hypothetical protein